MKKAFLPALLWGLVITGLSVLPSVQLPKFDLFSTDKLIHAGVYGLLTWLLLRGFAQAKGRSATVREGRWAFVCSAAYGALMEWVQYAFVPGRFCEFDDMLANAFGAAVVWAFSSWFTRRRSIA